MGAVDWWGEAACRWEEVGTELFFSTIAENEAKKICAGCPVREPCLRYALEHRQNEGVWGGLSADERLAYLWSAVRGGPPLSTVTYTTRARSTGAVCSAGRTPSGWGTECETHDSRATVRSRTAAENAVSRPQEWCPGCADDYWSAESSCLG